MKHKKIFIALYAVLILLGLVMALVSASGWAFVALGVFGIVYAVIKKPEPIEDPAPKYNITAAYIDHGPAKAPEGMPSKKPRKQITTKVAGVTFECDLVNKNRQDILYEVYEGSPVEIQEYEYKGDQAYYVIDPKTGADIGNLPAAVAEKIQQFEDPVFEAYITRCDVFEPRQNQDPIVYCEIRLFVI